MIDWKAPQIPLFAMMLGYLPTIVLQFAAPKYWLGGMILFAAWCVPGTIWFAICSIRTCRAGNLPMAVKAQIMFVIFMLVAAGMSYQTWMRRNQNIRHEKNAESQPVKMIQIEDIEGCEAK